MHWVYTVMTIDLTTLSCTFVLIRDLTRGTDAGRRRRSQQLHKWLIDMIVSANGTHVLSTTDMKRKYGPSIQTKQVHALHRIAYMLHTEEPVIDVKSTDLSSP